MVKITWQTWGKELGMVYEEVFSETVGSCGVFTYIYPNPETLAYKKPVFLQGILGVVHPNV